MKGLRPWIYLGEDGVLHLKRNHVVSQPVAVSLPLGCVLSLRCIECGDPIEYEKACYTAKETAAWLVKHYMVEHEEVTDV